MSALYSNFITYSPRTTTWNYMRNVLESVSTTMKKKEKNKPEKPRTSLKKPKNCTESKGNSMQNRGTRRK